MTEEPDEPGAPKPDAESAAQEALSRARKAARDKGFRPGMKPKRKPRLRDSAPRQGDDGRDPALIGEQIDRLMVERGWQGDVQIGSVMGRWAQIVGPDIAAHATPESFEGRVLTVRADSTAWATQLRLLSSAMLGRIAADVGEGVVTDLQIKGPSTRGWGRGRLRVEGRGPRDTFG